MSECVGEWVSECEKESNAQKRAAVWIRCKFTGLYRYLTENGL